MIIVACICQGYGIGKDGRIPWKNTHDMKWFKKITMGNTLLVGKNTILPPLPGRNVVVLQDRNMIDDPQYRNAMLIGGAKVWIDALQKGYIERIYLTVIDEYYECDTYFPIEYLQYYTLDTIITLSDSTSVFVYIKNNQKNM